jgi:hypothetical protein
MKSDGTDSKLLEGWQSAKAGMANAKFKNPNPRVALRP